MSIRFRHILTTLAVPLLAPLLLAQESTPELSARKAMVETSIVAGGISDQRVIHAMGKVPRHEFVSKPHRKNAYFDMALPIGGGQTISPPYVVAFMTEALHPEPSDRVLEIGTGSGYQAAVLSALVDQVYSIEIVESLGKRSARTLRRLKYDNVHLKIGDGFLGWPEHAPFNKIIVTCSPESIPQPLIDQLAEGGRMVIPLGERFQQRLFLFRKQDGQLVRESLEWTFFVPMTGMAEENRQQHIDEATPRLHHGSFEDLMKDGDPKGWFYIRQATASDSMGATDGERSLVFKNSNSGRPAHAMQAFGVDGRQFSRMTLEFDTRANDVHAGRSDHERPCVMIEFYGNKRAAVGSKTLESLTGSFDWQAKQYTIPIPSSARLAIVGVGLFGGTGQLAFDNFRITEFTRREASR